MNKYKKLKKDDLIRIADIMGRTLDYLHNIAARHISAKYKKGNRASAIHKKNLSYSFIPYDSQTLVPLLLKTRSVLNLTEKPNIFTSYRFLDAGCGAGNVMLLASKIGFDVYGLEIDPTIIAFTEKLKILPGCIKRQNILTYKRYGEYDVIYFFRPIANKTKQAKFEKLLKEQMKIGAVLIPVFEADRGIIRDKRFKRIHVDQRSHIYQKIAK
jgi:SAM-dependent methyltransferase